MKSKFLLGSSMSKPQDKSSLFIWGAPGHSMGGTRTIGDIIGEPTPHWSASETYESESDRAVTMIVDAARRHGVVK